MQLFNRLLFIFKVLYGIHPQKEVWFFIGLYSFITNFSVARDINRREHSSDNHSEPSGKTGSTPSIGQRTSSGGAKSLKSLRSMRSYIQSATGEIYPPNIRIRGVSPIIMKIIKFKLYIIWQIKVYLIYNVLNDFYYDDSI